MDPALVCLIAESCEKTLDIEKGGLPVESTPVLVCLSFGLLSLSAQAMASPAEAGVVGIAPEARKEIRIRASVRPTMRVSQLSASAAGGSRTQLLFCVWSNSPIGRYDVGIKLGSSQIQGGAGALSARLAWGGTAAVASHDGQLWIRDQLAGVNHPTCSTKDSVLTAMAARYGTWGEMPANGVMTVLIAPQ